MIANSSRAAAAAPLAGARSTARRGSLRLAGRASPTGRPLAPSGGATTRATLVGPEKRTSGAAGASTREAPSTSLSPEQSDLLSGREVEERAMWRCIERHEAWLASSEERGSGATGLPERWNAELLEEAYERCAYVTSEYAKTFYLGTQLMTPEQAKAIWAIYVWCRRTDELVDGPNASRITPEALDRWEERLEAIFDGKPYDILDAALTDTIQRFPVDIQPFRDMVDGMRMDLQKSRYETFDELYEYCYRVAGTVALMSVPVMGIDPNFNGPIEKVYRTALALGTANQLTNILRDVGEDIRERNRIYVPLEEIEQYGMTEADLIQGLHAPSTGEMDDRWKGFMKFQIDRAQEYFVEAENGVSTLEVKARWPVWSALDLYRKILPAIEANGYDNFSKRAYVPKAEKFAALPGSYLKAQFPTLVGKI